MHDFAAWACLIAVALCFGNLVEVALLDVGRILKRWID
jgi:hypothetical protein